jgi:hypothetical protein
MGFDRAGDPAHTLRIAGRGVVASFELFMQNQPDDMILQLCLRCYGQGCRWCLGKGVVHVPREAVSRKDGQLHLPPQVPTPLRFQKSSRP